MNLLADRIDLFVRWFFNVSPTMTSIAPEPVATGPLSNPVLRTGVLGSAVLIALVLLAVFYSVVAGAVERAAQHRMDARVVTAVSTR